MEIGVDCKSRYLTRDWTLEVCRNISSVVILAKVRLANIIVEMDSISQ